MKDTDVIDLNRILEGYKSQQYTLEEIDEELKKHYRVDFLKEKATLHDERRGDMLVTQDILELAVHNKSLSDRTVKALLEAALEIIE